jgi:hypothetical protein
MLSFITQLTASHYQHLCSSHAAANPRCSSTTASPGGFGALEPGLGLQGIAAGLAAGADVFGTTGGPRWGPLGAAAASHGAGVSSTAAADAHAIAQHMHAHAVRAGSPAGVACASGCAAGDWLPLESGLYAANVVLGKQRGEAAAQQVQQLVQYAAAAVSHPGGEALKLFCCYCLLNETERISNTKLCGDLCPARVAYASGCLAGDDLPLDRVRWHARAAGTAVHVWAATLWSGSCALHRLCEGRRETSWQLALPNHVHNMQ